MAFRYKCSLAILLATSVFAQSSPRAGFEVASIRPSAPTGQTGFSTGLHIDGSQVRCISWTLRDYAAMAYGVRTTMVNGPDWTGTDHFDISAAIPAGAPQSQAPEMMQALLADRFRLKVHKETREFPVYVLLAGPPSPRLKEAAPESSPQKDEPEGAINISAGGSNTSVGVSLGHGAAFTFANNRFDAKALTMYNFAYSLEWYVDRLIVDKTGLTARYDFAVDFTPEDFRAMQIQAAVRAGAQLPPQALRLLDGHSSEAVGDALRQVGLRLEARKMPLDVIVIDSALKTPTEN